jgi:hypothetical protein
MQDVPRQAGTHEDPTPPAPGDLELVRSFLSIHDHVHGTKDSLAPSLETIRWWLGHRGLIAAGDQPTEEDLRWASDVLEALRTRVRESMGDPRDDDAIGTLDAAAREAGLSVRFGDEGLQPTAPGVLGAVGRILAIAFLSELEGTWSRFKECSSPVCRSVFWDRSKNRSGRWCTMKDCGNRAKVRAYRARASAEA